MKKIVPFLILMLAVCSCSDDVKFNNQAAFQSVVNNVFFKGSSAKAERNADVNLTIQAVTFTEVMKLQIPVPPTTINPKDKNTFVTYPIGTSATKTAYYSVTTPDGLKEYKTGIAFGDGQVVVSEYDGTNVSGTFRFNAKSTDPDSDEIVNVQGGFFYKVPVVSAP